MQHADINAMRADGKSFAAAVQIDLADGRTDIVIIAENPCHVEAGGLSLDGQMGFVRLRDGEVEAAKLVRGTKLTYNDYTLEAEWAEITGRLTGFDVSDWQDNLLMVEPSVLAEGMAADDLIGKYIIVKNSERSDGSYLIRDVRENGTVIVAGHKGTLLLSDDEGVSFFLRELSDRQALSSVIQTSDDALILIGEFGVNRLDAKNAETPAP